MKYVIVRLSDSKDATKFLDLKFKLLDNGFVKKWIDCVLEAQQNQYPISEPWAIYNLNNKMNGEFVKGIPTVIVFSMAFISFKAV